MKKPQNTDINPDEILEKKALDEWISDRDLENAEQKDKGKLFVSVTNQRREEGREQAKRHLKYAKNIPVKSF